MIYVILMCDSRDISTEDVVSFYRVRIYPALSQEIGELILKTYTLIF